MALVTTSAVVLRTYPYSETSKIVRLATRDLGVQSAIAKGVLRPKSRFAGGLEVLSEGMAQLYHRETRELQTLAAFDLLVLRRELAQDVGRFAGADRKSTRLNSSHLVISYAVFCLKKKKQNKYTHLKF